MVMRQTAVQVRANTVEKKEAAKRRTNRRKSIFEKSNACPSLQRPVMGTTSPTCLTDTRKAYEDDGGKQTVDNEIRSRDDEKIGRRRDVAGTCIPNEDRPVLLVPDAQRRRKNDNVEDDEEKQVEALRDSIAVPRETPEEESQRHCEQNGSGDVTHEKEGISVEAVHDSSEQKTQLQSRVHVPLLFLRNVGHGHRTTLRNGGSAGRREGGAHRSLGIRHRLSFLHVGG